MAAKHLLIKELQLSCLFIQIISITGKFLPTTAPKRSGYDLNDNGRSSYVNVVIVNMVGSEATYSPMKRDVSSKSEKNTF